MSIAHSAQSQPRTQPEGMPRSVKQILSMWQLYLLRLVDKI